MDARQQAPVLGRLRLSCVPEWREGEGLPDNWPSVRRAVLERDDFSCVLCGFRSEKYMEVHHLLGRHRDNSGGNLVVLCPFCHSCLHVGFSGIERRGMLLETDGQTRQERLNRFLLEELRAGVAYRSLKDLPPALGLSVIAAFSPEHLVTLANVLLEHGGTAPDKYMYFPDPAAYSIVKFLTGQK